MGMGLGSGLGFGVWAVGALLSRGVVFEAFGNLCGLLVAHMEIEAPAERDAAARRDGIVAGFRPVLEIFEIVLPKIS